MLLQYYAMVLRVAALVTVSMVTNQELKNFGGLLGYKCRKKMEFSSPTSLFLPVTHALITLIRVKCRYTIFYWFIATDTTFGYVLTVS